MVSATADDLQGLPGLGARRRVLIPGISEVRGPAASMRRDALFRRMLALGDIIALIGAFRSPSSSPAGLSA